MKSDLALYHMPTSADLRLKRKAVDSPEVPLLQSKFHMHDKLIFNKKKLQDLMTDH